MPQSEELAIDCGFAHSLNMSIGFSLDMNSVLIASDGHLHCVRAVSALWVRSACFADWQSQEGF